MKKKKPVSRFKFSTVVETVGHSHPDVGPGTKGVIVCKKDGGYGVKITGLWLVAGNDRGTMIHETRTVWFDVKNLRKLK